jgi:diacylglycerol kinase (ATP)
MASDTQPRHFAFIVNPVAGRRPWPDLDQKINLAFQAQPFGHTFEIIRTDRAGHASDLAAGLAARHGAALVAFACGGDGTANEVVNGLAGTPAALGILPIGTANDFARAALTRNDPDGLISRLPWPDIRPIDVIRVDERICLNIASLGFDTKVQRNATALTARARWLGKLSYPLAIIQALVGNREYPMHYHLETIDEQNQAGIAEGDARFILAAICNGRYYGGGFNPAPQARIADGRLDFCLVDSLPLRRILPLIPLYKQGRHLSDPAVHSFQVTGGRIEAGTGMLLGNCDGESFEKQTIDFQVLPLALRFAFY